MREVAKFNLNELLGIGFTLVVLGIGLAYGLQIMSDVRNDEITGAAGCNSTDTSSCSNAFNAISNATTGVSKIPEKLPTIATVVVASVIIGILVTYLWARFAR
tara:strand:- start:57 stop:365 length:309 start_codon:yes stop_codon:yes gene_type:complete